MLVNILGGLILYIPVNSYGHAGTSVHLTTLFSWGSLNKQLTSTSCTYFRLYLKTTLLESAEGRRMTALIISWSISIKVWDRAGIELATPESAVRHVSAASHITHFATRPGMLVNMNNFR